MKYFLVIILLSLNSFMMAQDIPLNLSKNDTLINILLKKNLLGSYIDYKKNKTQITGNKISDTLFVYIKHKKYKVNLANLNNHFENINDSLIRSGYLFSKLKPDSIRLIQNKMQIFYHIEKKNPTKIDSLIIISDKKFPENIRKNLFNYVSKKTINTQTINDLSYLLNTDSGFKLDEEPVINFYRGKRMLVLKTQKTQNNLLDGIIGLNYNQQNSKLQLEVYLKSAFFNILNAGEQIKFEWQKKNDNQIMQLKTRFPNIRGTRFILSNFLSSKRKDTTNFTLTNQTRLTYHLKKQSFGLNFTYQLKSDTNNNFINRFAGINYYKMFKTKKNNWKAGVKVQFDIEINTPNKKLLYTSFHSSENLQSHIKLSHSFQVYKTNQNNFSVPGYLQAGMFRKISMLNEEFTEVTSIKNEIFYHEKHTDFYLISDYISVTKRVNLTTNYVNIGLGVNFFKKNQSLNIEIVKPLNLTYNTDLQSVYINIKQSVRF